MLIPNKTNFNYKDKLRLNHIALNPSIYRVSQNEWIILKHPTVELMGLKKKICFLGSTQITSQNLLTQRDKVLFTYVHSFF